MGQTREKRITILPGRFAGNKERWKHIPGKRSLSLFTLFTGAVLIIAAMLLLDYVIYMHAFNLIDIKKMLRRYQALNV